MVTGWVMVGRTVSGLMVCTPVPGMVNWIRLVVPAGGGFAFELRIAWRSEPAPLSLVLVTGKVINGVAVGVGVGVAPGASPLSTGGEVERVVLNALLNMEASKIEEVANKATSRVIRSAKARPGLFLFILFFGV
jgi:hypothetical protein